MTDYRLPPGMTAKNLRFMADDLRSHNFVVFASTLGSWADAIDPPKPEPVVTDEMVEAVRYEAASLVVSAATRRLLEAAVKCGWTPPRELSQEGGPTASSSEAVAPGSQAGGEAGVPQGPCPESESLSPPPPSLAVGEKVDCMACRLAMAEGLLRRVGGDLHHVSGADQWALDVNACLLGIATDEAEYLWSLVEEGDGDE